MSENAATIAHKYEIQDAHRSRPPAVSLFYLFLKIMLYGLVFGIPMLFLKRPEFDGSAYLSGYELFAYCGIMTFSIMEASKKLGSIQVIEVLKPNSSVFKSIIVPVIIGVLALTVILDQSNAFLEQPASLNLHKDVFGFLIAVLVAPMLEEILCRGIVLKYLLAETKPWVAILYSALFFSALHLNLYQGVPVFFAGLFLGWIYYRCKSIWPGVLAHAVNNVLGFACLLYFPAENQSYMNILGLTKYIAVLIFSVVAIGICFWAIHLKARSVGLASD